jgi:integrase
VRKLEATPSKHPLAKCAFLFACYCGLRTSDIRRLKWSDLEKDGDSYRINIIMHKTQAPIYIPLSKRAIKWIPERKDMSEDALLFPGLPEQVSAPLYLNDWIKAAGITKNITFHSSRHTYGCLQLNNGTPLHVVQHMLGHKNITTTEVYAKMNDEQKMQTVSRITLKHD